MGKGEREKETKTGRNWATTVLSVVLTLWAAVELYRHQDGAPTFDDLTGLDRNILENQLIDSSQILQHMGASLTDAFDSVPECDVKSWLESYPDFFTKDTLPMTEPVLGSGLSTHEMPVYIPTEPVHTAKQFKDYKVTASGIRQRLAEAEAPDARLDVLFPGTGTSIGGIPREIMPIPTPNNATHSDNEDQWTAILIKNAQDQGINVYNGTITVDELRSVQDTVSSFVPTLIISKAEKNPQKHPQGRKILTANGPNGTYVVLDGNHGMTANILMDGETQDILHFDAPWQYVLSLTLSHPGTRVGNAPGPAKPYHEVTVQGKEAGVDAAVLCSPLVGPMPENCITDGSRIIDLSDICYSARLAEDQLGVFNNPDSSEEEREQALDVIRVITPTLRDAMPLLTHVVWVMDDIHTERKGLLSVSDLVDRLEETANDYQMSQGMMSK